MDSNTVGFAILCALIGTFTVLIAYIVIRIALVDHDEAKERKRRGT